MPNQLSLAARYRNAKAERVPYERMSPALQCMDALADYRAAVEARDDYPVFTYGDEADAAAVFDDDKEYAAVLFATARAKLRSAIRFNNAVEVA